MAEANSKFSEGWVEADGFRIRYKAAGEGPPLVHLHGAGGLRLTPAHELLVPQVPRPCVRDARIRGGRQPAHANHA